jgi:hypothetical protein
LTTGAVLTFSNNFPILRFSLFLTIVFEMPFATAPPKNPPAISPIALAFSSFFHLSLYFPAISKSIFFLSKVFFLVVVFFETS